MVPRDRMLLRYTMMEHAIFRNLQVNHRQKDLAQVYYNIKYFRLRPIHGRNFRMKRIAVLCLAFLFSLLSVSCSCTESFELIIDNEQLRSYSVEELIEVFNQYHEEFNQVAVIVLENNAIEQVMLNSKEEIISIWTETQSSFFSEEEWSKIEELFRLTGMNRIERSIKSGKDVIKFLFRDSTFTTKLFYCVTDDKQDLLYHKQRTSIFQKIDEYWWVGCSFDSITPVSTTVGYH